MACLPLERRIQPDFQTNYQIHTSMLAQPTLIAFPSYMKRSLPFPNLVRVCVFARLNLSSEMSGGVKSPADDRTDEIRFLPLSVILPLQLGD
jgi:hypothetical protein